jgi:hypothetical protein
MYKQLNLKRFEFFERRRVCRQASTLPNHNEVRGNEYKAVEYASFTVIYSKVLSTLVTQLDEDFVKVSSKVFIVVFFFWVVGRLKICHLVPVYATNVFGFRNVTSEAVCVVVHIAGTGNMKPCYRKHI